MAANGSVELAALAARLKAVGAADLRLELLRGLKVGAAPLVDDVKQAALEKLPRRGGLNRQVAGQKISVSVRTSVATAGVRLTTTAPDTAQTDQGYVRHPVFGNRGRWVHQDIPEAAGWWSQTLAQGAPVVTPALLAVMEKIAAEVQLR